MAKDKPGMMMYWEMFDMLDRVDPEQVKPLLQAMRRFSQDGEVPDFHNDKMLEFAWPMIAQKITADCERYEAIRKQRTDAINARWEKERAKASAEYGSIQPNTGVYDNVRNIPTSTTSSTTTATSTTTSAGASTTGAGNAPARAYGCCHNVFMTDDEYDALCADIPDAGNVIEKLSLHMKSSGKKYADHAATVRKWALEDAERKQNAPTSGGDWALSTNRTPYSDARQYIIPELLED